MYQQVMTNVLVLDSFARYSLNLTFIVPCVSDKPDPCRLAAYARDTKDFD